jgi:hypothetical protein
MTTAKLNRIERAIVAAASMPAPEARKVVTSLLAQLKEVERRALTRYAKDVLYMGKIVPNADSPRHVARYFAQELFDCPPRGARSLGWIVERRWNEQRFSLKC